MAIEKKNADQVQRLATLRRPDPTETLTDLEDEIRLDFGGLAEQARSATDLPGYFWQRQQAAIRSRIAVEQASKQPLKGFVWATIVGLCLLALVILKSRPTLPAVPQARAVQMESEDDDVMAVVEETVGRNVPEALAPAALLAEDISSAVEPSYQKDRTQKEKRNEN